MNSKKEKEQLYSRNFTKHSLELNMHVSVVTAILLLAFSILTIIKTNVSAELFASANILIDKNINGLFITNMYTLFAYLFSIAFYNSHNIRFGAYTSETKFMVQLY